MVILTHVEHAVREAGLVPDEPLLVGFSGGVDSLALADALLQLQHRGAVPSPIGIHVNHRLRPEADADADRAAALADALGLPLTVVVVDVDAWRSAAPGGTEAAARAARYAAFAGIARDLGATWLATGHQRDDQAETVLLRLFRGSSLAGLGGMRRRSTRHIPLWPDGAETQALSILRPLLNVSRSDIERYAAERGLRPIVDPSNVSSSFRRNVIRHRVLPEVERAIPGSGVAIARTADVLQADEDLMSRLVAPYVESLVQAEGPIVGVERVGCRLLDPALQRRVIASAVDQLTAGVLTLSLNRLEALRAAVLSGRPSALIEIGRDLVAYVDYERVWIGPRGCLEDALRRQSGLPLLEPGQVVRVTGPCDLSLGNGWRLRLRPTTTGTWTVRTRRPGDRLARPDGTVARLQDQFVNAKVPAYVRDWLPLIERGGVIRWIGGISPNPPADLVLRLERRETTTDGPDRGSARA